MQRLVSMGSGAPRSSAVQRVRELDTILLVDGRRLERDTLSTTLERMLPEARVDAVVDVAGAVEYLQRRPRTDIILVDNAVLRDDWLKPLHGLVRASRSARIVVLSCPFHDGMQRALETAGVSGAFSSNIGIIDLADRLKRIRTGEQIFELPRLADRRAQMREEFGLTDREYQVMEMLAQGAANGQIANWLDISESTVRVHVSSAFRKLGVNTRIQAYEKWRKSEPGIRASAS
jgi:DNA-binding NarL/FixJ family response regulator